jgi:hypothetical protein
MMAEMLIWMQDREGADIYHTTKLAQRGDVIVVQPDGWGWTLAEQTDPFTVVVVPDATVADLESFLSPEMPQPGNEDALWWETTNTLQFRGFKVDVDAYVPPAGGVLSSGTSVPLDDVLALKVQKPPVQDPSVIGDSGRIIG